MADILERILEKVAEHVGNMHCPICKVVNYVGGGDDLVQCWSCRNWAHIDNWTYTKKAWARIQERKTV